MRIQDISAGSVIGQEDLLLGSQFIEKGKYKNKNFAIKDLINHIRSGLAADQGGTFAIQHAKQDKDSPYTTPAAVLNRISYDIYVPANGMLLVTMVNSNCGACNDLYLFTRTDVVIGASSTPVQDRDFILLRSSVENRNLEMEGSFTLRPFHHKGLIFVKAEQDTKTLITIPETLQEDFEVEIIQSGTGEVKFITADPTKAGFLSGNKIDGDMQKVQVIRRKKNGMYHLFGKVTW